MNILALDCATGILSVALGTDEGSWYFEINSGLRHSERLLELCRSALASAGIFSKDLDLVACMRGPGSFTGLRIGFAAAKGLAVSLGIPLLSVPTLDCMAASLAFWPGIVVPVIDAKKSCFFAALYGDGGRMSDYLDIEPERLARLVPPERPLILTGPDAAAAGETLSGILAGNAIHIDPRGCRGYAQELMRIAKERFLRDGAGDEDSSGPVYLRKSDAELMMEDRNSEPGGRHG